MKKEKEYLVIFKKNKTILTAHKFKNFTVKDVKNQFTDKGWQWNDKLLYIIDDTKILYPNENKLT